MYFVPNMAKTDIYVKKLRCIGYLCVCIFKEEKWICRMYLATLSKTPKCRPQGEMEFHYTVYWRKVWFETNKMRYDDHLPLNFKGAVHTFLILNGYKLIYQILKICVKSLFVFYRPLMVTHSRVSPWFCQIYLRKKAIQCQCVWSFKSFW